MTASDSALPVPEAVEAAPGTGRLRTAFIRGARKR